MFLSTSDSFLMHSCISQWLEFALDKQFGRDKAELPAVKTDEPHPPSAPPKKPLPDLRSLGPLPPKPTRPPLVDLSCYHLPTVNGMLTLFSISVVALFFFDVCFPP